MRKLTDELDVCPFIDSEMPWCASHFVVENVYEAMRHCVGEHHSCAVYRWAKGAAGASLPDSQAQQREHTSHFLRLTLHGRPLGATG